MTFSADPRESTSAPATRSTAPFDPVLTTRRPIDTAYSKLPLYFEANQGQTDPSVKFLARGTGYTLFLTANGAVVALRGSREESAIVRMRLVGANASPHMEGSDQLLGKVNYFKGADPEQHISEIPTFARVKYSGVYPGVDLIYYGNERLLEYDFVVASGADPSAIKLAFEGAENLEIDSQGDLIIRSTGGKLSLRKPLVYQEVAGTRREIASAYVLEAESESDHRTVGFRIGSYDRARQLVIDPVLIYSTYLGGSGDEGEDSHAPNYKGGDIAVDVAGNMYVAGTTSSTDFPTTPGGDQTRSGDRDAYVTKFDAAGNLVYSTYFGGACTDRGNAVAVDSDGNAYLTGRAHEACNSYSDPTDGAFVAKLGATGAPLYFFTFGGEYDLSEGLDIALQETVVAGQKRVYAYVVGQTNATDFPTTHGAFQSVYGGWRWDAFVAKINPQGTGFVYSTFLGGNDTESGNSIAVDASGNAYVTGSTVSRNFPTRNALQPEHGATGPLEATAFVAKLLPDGSDLVYSTYLGGWNESAAQGIAVDAGGNAYITGTTIASNFVTTPGVVQPDFGFNLCLGDQYCRRAFIVKLNASGSARVYSTFLYGFGYTGGNAIAVDANDNAYVTGWVQSNYFPIVKAFQSSRRGVSDAFVAKLNADASRLVYSSYLGGDPIGDTAALYDQDEGAGIALDALGNAYVAGYTKSADFPTTPDVFQPVYGGGMCGPTGLQGPCYDAFVTKISASGEGIVPPINLRALPADVPVGGTVTATWAGIPVPTASDELRLYTLASASGGYDHVAAWPTTGASSGTLSLALPPTLEPRWYELRLLSPDPDTSGLLSVIARSEPIKVASAPAPAPTPTALTLNPTAVTAGTPSTATVTLSAAVPAGGISVTLSSSNSAVATVLPTVSVAAGASSATFTVTTKPVVAAAALTISATTGGVTKTAVLTVNPTPTYTLTVTKAGTGSGTVSSTPAGISCGTDCTEPYNSGTLVNLTATAAAGSGFASWSGACTGTGACSVVISAAKSVTATFNTTPVSQPTVTLAASDVTATESGATTGKFKITRTGDTTTALAVFYAVSGTATPGADYAALAGSVTIPAGATFAYVTVTPLNDAIVEPSETVIMTLSPNAAYVVGTGTSPKVTIQDNDTIVTIAASDGTATEVGPTTGAFTVTRAGYTGAALTVRYTLAGTATKAVDYASLSGILTVPAGATSATITVTPIDDALAEPGETAISALSTNSAYTIGASGSATVTIISNE